jgi:hypothetical protein
MTALPTDIFTLIESEKILGHRSRWDGDALRRYFRFVVAACDG